MPESARCAGRAPWRRSGAKTRLKGGTLAGVMVSFAAQHHQFGGPLNGRPAHHGGLGTPNAGPTAAVGSARSARGNRFPPRVTTPRLSEPQPRPRPPPGSSHGLLLVGTGPG